MSTIDDGGQCHDTGATPDTGAERALSCTAEAAQRMMRGQETWDAVIQLIADLGQAFGADRCYLFENRLTASGSPAAVQRCEWTAQGVRSELGNELLKGVSYEDAGMGRWLPALTAGEIVGGPVSALPESERALLGPQGILSVLVVPILVSGRLWGFIGFDDCVSERAWDRSEVRSLQLAAGLIGGALERRETQAQQERMEAALRQQQRLDSIGTLAGGVAHEINNPINGVMNYAQLLKDRFPNESMALAICDGIIEESERIATITRDLLQFARREERGHSRARVIDLVNGTLNLIRTVFRHERIQLEVSVPSHLPEIICRTQQIQQVIMNLLTNARDAVNTPGLECDRRVLLSAVCVEAPDRRLVRITVEDSGPGIPVEAREQLYDPFFTTKQGRGGTGLGLAICHGIVRDHHGQLWFETELGRFTRFHLDLPVGIPPYSRPIDTCNAPGESLLETPTS